MTGTRSAGAEAVGSAMGDGIDVGGGMAAPAPVPVSLAVSPRTAHKTRSRVQYASVAAATPLEPQHGPKASGRVKTRSHIAGGLPVVSLLVVCAVQFMEGVQITMLFPFVVFMLRDFGYSEETVGTHAGMLSASFCVAQFTSSVAWGWMSDRAGRRVTIMVGVSGTAAAVTVFGFSNSFAQAMVSRTMAGLLNGNIGVMKAMLTEMTNDSNRAFAFSTLPLAWGAGCIVGPLVGGVLARPHMQYPGVEWGIFETFPYLLPCGVCVVLQSLTFLSVWCCLPADSPASASASASASNGGNKGQGRCCLCCRRSRNSDRDAVAYQSVELATATHSDGGDDNVGEQRAQNSTTAGGGASSQPRAPIVPAAAKGAARWVLCTRNVLQPVFGYTVIAMTYTCFDELVPLWGSGLVSDGGLGLSTRSVGMILVSAGASLIVFTVFVFPFLAKRVSYKSMLITSFACGAATYSFVPVSGLLLDATPALFWGSVIAFQFWRMGVASLGFTAVMIMVNNSVQSRHLGRVNGLAQSCAALARAVGPALAGGAWSAGVRAGFAGHEFLVFGLLTALNLIGLVTAVSLPASLQTSLTNAPAPDAVSDDAAGSGAGTDSPSAELEAGAGVKGRPRSSGSSRSTPYLTTGADGARGGDYDDHHDGSDSEGVPGAQEFSIGGASDTDDDDDALLLV